MFNFSLIILCYRISAEQLRFQKKLMFLFENVLSKSKIAYKSNIIIHYIICKEHIYRHYTSNNRQRHICAYSKGIETKTRRIVLLPMYF